MITLSWCKQLAAKTHCMTQVVGDSLRLVLSVKKDNVEKVKGLVLRSFGGKGLNPELTWTTWEIF
jgi:hypothetical protein